MLADEKRMRYPSDQFICGRRGNGTRCSPSCPRHSTTRWLSPRKCNLLLEFGKLRFPVYHPPEGSQREVLRQLCEEGLQERYCIDWKAPKNTGEKGNSRERVEYELESDREDGVRESYFLIVWDFVHFAKSRSIPVGRGPRQRSRQRGGVRLEDHRHRSCVALSLLFERFLNPDRISPPDIDMDFCYNRRQRSSIRAQEYGEKASRRSSRRHARREMVVRDVGRVLGLP